MFIFTFQPVDVDQVGKHTLGRIRHFGSYKGLVVH